MAQRHSWLLPIGLVLLAGVPLLALPRFVQSTLTEMLIWGIFAMSLDLLLGYTGLASLGHAAFFGSGAYAAGLVALYLTRELPSMLLAAVLVALLAGLVVGALAVRSRGIYFLMLTLAFSQVFFAIAYKWTWLTGGSNGLAGIPRPTLLGLHLDSAGAYYLAALGGFALAVAVLWAVVRSPLGHALVGIRENEARMEWLGYHTWRYKLAAFALAAMLAGLAGGLFAGFNGFVAPADVYWTTSGLVLVMVIIGGPGTLVGPVLGAVLVLLLQNFVGSIPRVGERWPMIMGLVFIVFVLAGRGGLLGLARRLAARMVVPPKTSSG